MKEAREDLLVKIKKMLRNLNAVNAKISIAKFQLGQSVSFGGFTVALDKNLMEPQILPD